MTDRSTDQGNQEWDFIVRQQSAKAEIAATYEAYKALERRLRQQVVEIQEAHAVALEEIEKLRERLNWKRRRRRKP